MLAPSPFRPIGYTVVTALAVAIGLVKSTVGKDPLSAAGVDGVLVAVAGVVFVEIVVELRRRHGRPDRDGRVAEDKTGEYLGIPYDVRRPTAARFKQRWWNPAARRLLTPKTFGWGYDLNLARLFRRRRPTHSEGQSHATGHDANACDCERVVHAPKITT